MIRSRCHVVIVAAAMSGAALSWGQDKPGGTSLFESARRLWNPEAMMKKACDGIARHYNLDAGQKEFTCKLLTERTTRFMDKHESQMWPLLTELMPYQFGGEMPDTEAAKSIASRGHPIFQEARQEIMKAQDEFRTILNDEQKKIHDRDLKGLDRTFGMIDTRFKDWESGKVQGTSPLQNVQIIGGGVIGQPGQVVDKTAPRMPGRVQRGETEWERYVKDFVRQYSLDESQKNAAEAILKDLQDQANVYRKTHEKDIQDAGRMVREARASKPFDAQLVEQAAYIQDMLNKPVQDYFEELKRRLDQIPTEKQKEEYLKQTQELVERAAAAGKTQAPTTAPSSSPTSQPDATSQPTGVP